MTTAPNPANASGALNITTAPNPPNATGAPNITTAPNPANVTGAPNVTTIAPQTTGPAHTPIPTEVPSTPPPGSWLRVVCSTADDVYVNDVLEYVQDNIETLHDRGVYSAAECKPPPPLIPPPPASRAGLIVGIVFGFFIMGLCLAIVASSHSIEAKRRTLKKGSTHILVATTRLE